jgi:hypothetical protein
MRGVRGVVQNFAKPIHRGVEAVVEVNKRIIGPQPALEFLAGDQFAGALQQRDQYLQGLFLQPDLYALLAKLPRPEINFENSEAKDLG